MKTKAAKQPKQAKQVRVKDMKPKKDVKGGGGVSRLFGDSNGDRFNGSLADGRYTVTAIANQ